MSGEYGGYHTGYMDRQLEGLAQDFRDAKTPGSEGQAMICDALAKIANGICYYKASDSGIDDPILTGIRMIDQIKRGLEIMEEDLSPYKRCMEEAVREHVKKTSKD